jgi:acyl-[acyl carrier protein]--UDP-N-acetylglucosamine O-acyltransferase
MTVEGNPAEVRGPNRIAMERRGYPERDIDAIKECYKRLFRSGGGRGGDRADNGSDRLIMAERIESLLTEFTECPPVRNLCEFLQRMAAGVHGRSRELNRPDDKRALRLARVGNQRAQD